MDALLKIVDLFLDPKQNDASHFARNVYITFLLLGTYIAVIIGSTTHEQLLKVSPVTF